MAKIYEDSPEDEILSLCAHPLESTHDFLHQTILHHAIGAKQYSLLLRLLDVRPELRALTNGTGQTFLHVLAPHNPPETQEILRKSLDISVLRDRRGRTFWHLWIPRLSDGQLGGVLKEFLGQIQVDVADNEGNTVGDILRPQLLRIQDFVWEEFGKTKSLQSLRGLAHIFKNFKRNLQVYDLELQTIQMEFAHALGPDELRDLLEAKTVTTEHRDRSGRTLGMRLLTGKDALSLDKIRILLQMYRNTGIFDYQLNTLFHYVVNSELGSQEKVSLFEYLTDTLDNNKVANGLRAINVTGSCVLNEAVKTLDIELVEEVLKRLIKYTEVYTYGDFQELKNQLHSDCSRRGTGLGFDIEDYDEFKENPLNSALYRYRALDWKDKVRNLIARNDFGFIDPLETAIELGAIDIVNLLLESGANCRMSSSKGTPII